MKKSGILMPIASLPSQRGIGDFGPSAYEFVSLCKKSGFKIWQILPLNPLGYGNSPYQPYSSKAMDELYISLDVLMEEGLLNSVESFNQDAQCIDYEAVRDYKKQYLKQAYDNFEGDDEFEKFIDNKWVQDYAIFITFKKANGMKCWNEWPDKLKFLTEDSKLDFDEYKASIHYEMFIQYILLKQWKKLRSYANVHGIEVMGDIPFYVGLDSDDVWLNKNLFLLDKDGHPTFVAGVPPDYFSEDGQRWGNPIYNWEELEKEHFSFWLDRLNYMSELFDIVRIDHFRAFDTYWKIIESCPTAKDGEWMEAPGYKVFNAIYEKYPSIKIVAEDLGLMRDEVYELRDAFNLMGMRIVQYSWNPPKMGQDKENLLIYTGTHDNEPMRSWYSKMSKNEKMTTLRYFKKHNFRYPIIVDNFIQYTLNSNADIAIISIVDVLNKKIDCRLNTPGTVGKPNWQWKLSSFKEFRKCIRKTSRMIKKSKRI